MKIVEIQTILKTLHVCTFKSKEILIEFTQTFLNWEDKLVKYVIGVLKSRYSH